MRILVDADACPVVKIVEHTAEKYQIPVIFLCDTNHKLQSGYSEVLTVGAVWITDVLRNSLLQNM